MTEQTILAPIELTDDELVAVSGGLIAIGITQVNYQSAGLAQVGGNLSIGGGATSVSGNNSFSETFIFINPGIGSVLQRAISGNPGSVNATVTAS